MQISLLKIPAEMRKHLFILFGLLITLISNARNIVYQTFENSVLSLEANSVRFFLQDSQGYMWIGTNKGLFSFDGDESYSHFLPGTPENIMINCCLLYKEDHLLLGTEKGILMYNIKSDKYVPFELNITKDIRSMVLTDNDLWLGCVDGLYKYHLKSKKLNEMLTNPDYNRNKGIINALVVYKNYIYVGAFGLFGRFSLNSYLYEDIKSPENENRFVNALLVDNSRNCIWIGEGNKLTKYTPQTNSFESFEGFQVVKTIGIDCENNLLIGSDNGFYVFNETSVKQFLHNSKSSNSLANNIIWCVYRDRAGNIWLGTDYGISLSPSIRKFEYIPIFHFSGVEQGNLFYKIFKDSRGYYWLGGDNGLIRTRKYTSVDNDVKWYNMVDKKYYIPHNHIRDIFEDDMQNLWVATDYGICKYDYQSERFTKYYISSTDLTYNANWAYDLLDDGFGNIWISSYNGGIFKVNKKQFSGSKQFLIANTHFSKKEGLTTNIINQIAYDKKGNIWALNQNNGIDIISGSSGKITRFPICNYTEGKIPNKILNDNNGNIWIGFINGVIFIDIADNKVETIKLEDVENSQVFSLLQVNNKIWVSLSEALCIIDIDDFSINKISIPGKVFYSMFYEEDIDKVLLGGVDGLAVCSSSVIDSDEGSNKILISSITVNNKIYINEKNEPSIRYSNKIELPYSQNNIIIKFSNLQYSNENRSNSYVFKINNSDKNWARLNGNNNIIYLNKLSPGTYDLTIAKRGTDKSKITVLKTFIIEIHHPWYSTALAKIIYLLIFATFVYWGFTFFNQKHKLKIARIEKEKTIEQTKMKIDFFTNIAHEFKTPLSLIIAPLSRLIQEKKNRGEKDTLEVIYQNAIKLNSLVQQAIEYYRDDSDVPIGLVISRVELVEFTKSIFNSFRSNMIDRQLEFIFNSNFDKLFVDFDVIKMESIINNLLANACKFTNPGDTIILSLNYQSNQEHLEIKISDSGIGIPEKDLPYVFQRFFKSPANKKREGTGIGLYLVKRFVELHGGNVGVISNPNEGTTFTISIPHIVNNSIEPVELSDKFNSVSNGKPLLLIVEDNIAIAKLLQDIFIDDYRCIIAYNGKAGFKICMDLIPDIIITDIMMPIMDGMEMCQKIKENIQTSTIPIVMLTAKDDRETELQSINEKADAFIPKPFDSNILYSRVKQLLETKKQLDIKLRIDSLSSPVLNKEVSEDEKFLARITKIIEEQIADPDLNVSYLCNKVNVSQKQMYRKIKNLTGLTAVEYIKSVKMKKAALLLSNKNFTIAEVMYKVGFSNHSYFAKCFQSEFGKTPSQYIDQKLPDNQS